METATHLKRGLRLVGPPLLVAAAIVASGCRSNIGTDDHHQQPASGENLGSIQQALPLASDFCLNSLYTASGNFNLQRGTKCLISPRYRATEWTGGATPCTAYTDAWGGCSTYAGDTWSRTRGFSGYHWGLKGNDHIVYAPNGIDPFLYPMTWPQGQDITRYMNNLALDYGANNSTDLWYHAMGTAAGGYYKWFRRSGGAQYAPYDLLVLWNAADDAAYMVNHDPWWQGAAANIYVKYANLTYERGVLGMPTSNNFGDAWGLSWQRFTNGYITNRSNGYNDMGTTKLFYVGGAPGTIARHVAARYGALFDYPGASANAYALDYDIAPAMTCPTGPCTSAGRQVRVFNPTFSQPLQRYGWVIAQNGAPQAYAVIGAFAERWNQDSNWSYEPWKGRLGFPISDAIQISSEWWEQSFQGGKIVLRGSQATVAPRCSNICNETSSCSPENWCTSDSGQVTTCGQFGSCNVQAECQVQCAGTSGSPIPCDRECNNYGTPTKCYKMGAVCEGGADGMPSCNACNSASSCNESCLETIPVTGGYRVSKCSAFQCNTCADGVTCNAARPNCGATCKNASGATVTCESYAATNAGDKDLDGIPDSLELALARKFYPDLSLRDVHPAGKPATESDRRQFYGNTWSPLFSPNGILNPNIQLPFSVHPYRSATRCPEQFECLEIRYALLYNTDLGDSDVPFTSHRGDNEGYSVLLSRKPIGSVVTSWTDAKNNPNAWKAIGRLFSAHTCEFKLFRNWDNSQFVWHLAGRDTPDIAWVGDGKHGTYYSQSLCDSGSLNNDSCTSDIRALSSTNSERPHQLAALSNAGEMLCHPTFDVTINLPHAQTNTPPDPTELYTIWTGNNFASPPGQVSTETVDMMIQSNFIDWEHSKILCPNDGIGATSWAVLND